jgi:hypothetical protein
MAADLGSHVGLLGQADVCRLVIRKEKGPSEILQFVAAGLEIGQQVVVMAGPTCLKDIARSLNDRGFRPDALLHSGRLVFLTAPNCLADLFKNGDPFQRGPLHKNATVMRWVTDWSWAYTNGCQPCTIRDYQRRIHEYIRPLRALSMCTVHCDKLGRSDLLAMLVDHRRSSRRVEAERRMAQAGSAV